MTGGQDSLSLSFNPSRNSPSFVSLFPLSSLRPSLHGHSRAAKNIGHIAARLINFPGREISIDNPEKSRIISLSVNIVAKRTLTPPEIGDIVRKTRKAAGLRQDELAGAAGVGLRFIVDLEAGKPTAQIGKALQVLAALGCSFDITPPPEPEEGRRA